MMNEEDSNDVKSNLVSARKKATWVWEHSSRCLAG